MPWTTELLESIPDYEGRCDRFVCQVGSLSNEYPDFSIEAANLMKRTIPDDFPDEFTLMVKKKLENLENMRDVLSASRNIASVEVIGGKGATPGRLLKLLASISYLAVSNGGNVSTEGTDMEKLSAISTFVFE